MDGPYARHARVDILLQTMLRKKSKKVFTAFNLALRMTGCHDLADKLENTKGVVSGKPYMRDWSSDIILNAWPQIETYLMDELQPEYILDFFMQENIFSVDEYEEVFWSMDRRVEMRKKLLYKMKNHLPDALFVLLYALKEVDEEENTEMVAELEKLVLTGKDQQEASGTCHEKQPNTDVHLVTGHKATFSLTVPLSKNPVRAVRLTIEREGNVMENVEIEIDKYMNNTDAGGLLQVLLPLTGCEITKSERRCVTIHLRPHSKHAFDKLFEFCKKGGLENFVLNLMREKEIFNSLPSGELCIKIEVQYHEGELEAKAAEEPETDWTKPVRDNWSFLCEELDVQNLIRCSITKTMFTDQETTELEGSAAKDRHGAADYFLKCLLKKGPAGVNFLMDALREKKKMKILNRLHKSDPLYQNPQAVKENIIVHFESIVQEIDPTQFKDTFVDRNILDRKFFTDLREKHLRRRCRAALFLREVLNKGNRAIYALLDVMTDMGYDGLLAKLMSPEENLLHSNQQKKDQMKEDIVMKGSNRSSPEGFIWSRCLKINVDKKVKDETNEQGSSSQKEEPIYINFPWDTRDEGIGETVVTLRSREGLAKTNRPVTDPESSLSHYLEDSGKSMTFPRTRESEESRKSIRSLSSSAATGENIDSGIDISILDPDEFILKFYDEHFS
ncbi:hypothetical protein ACJMK2_040812 [Sinanodonta woodiana]|uniref:Uncharacterized protein n=1 Tax=Sinanodonta woodiana TaxID=1069815 RepID=A0ABD3W5U9_SINWO